MSDTNKGRRLDGCRAVVVGAGGSGRGAARLLHGLGARVRVLDKNGGKLPEDFRGWLAERGVELSLGEHHKGQFADADLVVMSPGASLAMISPLFPDGWGPEVLGEMELASRYVAEPILAVTGTNGKTTTVSLMAHMLRAAGRKVFLGGNIGTPLSEYVLSGDKADLLVLEASSFQLQTCSRFRPRVGVLLNFAADHLDYHADMEEYWQAKLRLFARQEEDDWAVVHADLEPAFAAQRPTKARTVFYRSAGRFPRSRLLGGHNQENLEAAYQACRIFGVSEAVAQEAAESFEPLPHRVAPVAEKHGVLFVDDSKATTVDALQAALLSFDRPVLLLAGGVYKGGDLHALVPVMRGKVRAVALFGAAREIFQTAWADDFAVTWDETLEQAVTRLAAMARQGDAVLLSPATASFDQYENYKARGKDFQRIVKELP